MTYISIICDSDDLTVNIKWTHERLMGYLSWSKCRQTVHKACVFVMVRNECNL